MLIGVGGVAVVSGRAIDPTTGLVTFTGVPTAGAAVTAGFQFDVPVRFDTDQLTINMSHFQAGQIQSIPVVEIRG